MGGCVGFTGKKNCSFQLPENTGCWLRRSRALHLLLLSLSGQFLLKGEGKLWAGRGGRLTSDFLVLKQTHARPHKGRQTAAVPSQPPPSDGLTVHSVTNAVQARLKKDLHKYTVLLNTQSNSQPLA